MIKFNLYFIFLFTLIFSSCGVNFDYIVINSESGFEKEIDFISGVIEKSEALEKSGLRLLRTDIDSDEQTPSLFIDFFSSWKHEYDLDCITISKTFFIPIDDPLSARTNTSLAACLDGTETLILIEELKPPYTALRVDGFAIDEDDYPLIRFSGIKIRSADDKKLTKRFVKKIFLTANEIKNALNPAISDSPQLIWVAAGGDVMLERGATEILLEEGPKGIFGGTAEMLLSADVSLINLEGVISDRGEAVRKSYTFRFIPEVAPALRDAGINAVLLANNHVFDYGEDAFLDSLLWLEKAQIGAVGAGRNIEDASKPYIFSNGKEEVHVYGIASFPRERNGWDGETAAADSDTPGMLHARKGGVEKLKEKFSSDANVTNILLFHGGVEWSHYPDAYTRELYTDLVTAGADIVIGSHPHTIQGFEWVKGKAVFWCLGDYIFGDMYDFPEGMYGLFIRLGLLNGSLLYLEPFPLFLDDVRTDITPPETLEIFYIRSKELRRRNPL